MNAVHAKRLDAEEPSMVVSSKPIARITLYESTMRSFSIRLLVCWLLWIASSVAAQGECQEDGHCPFDYSCQHGKCAPSDCIQKELKNFESIFDSPAYKEMLFREAGITEQDLWDARQQHPEDSDFVQSLPVQSLLQAVQAHSSELEQISKIVEACRSGSTDVGFAEDLGVNATKAEARVIGLAMGYLLTAIRNIILGMTGNLPDGQEGSENVAPSMSPSVSARPSARPSVSPSHAPTFGVASKIYIGVQLEGGILLDASFAFLVPSSERTNRADETNIFTRGCIGAELGLGGEVALIVLIANLRENNDLVGTSLLSELDVGLGVHTGVALGWYLDGDSTRNGNRALHYEIGLGVGAGLGIGASLCRTDLIPSYVNANATKN